MHSSNASSIKYDMILRILGCGSWWKQLLVVRVSKSRFIYESHACIMWISNRNRKNWNELRREDEKRKKNNKRLQGHFLLKNAQKIKSARAMDSCIFIQFYSFQCWSWQCYDHLRFHICWPVLGWLQSFDQWIHKIPVSSDEKTHIH